MTEWISKFLGFGYKHFVHGQILRKGVDFV